MRRLLLNSGEELLVSDRDWPLVRSHHWWADYRPTGRVYARTKIGGHNFYLHRLIKNVADEIRVDHWNRNGLDNRRCNLRVATPSQNGMNSGRSKANSSGCKGVDRHSLTRQWRARISVSGRQRHLGLFASKKKAALAYAKAARRLYGAFARTK